VARLASEVEVTTPALPSLGALAKVRHKDSNVLERIGPDGLKHASRVRSSVRLATGSLPPNSKRPKKGTGTAGKAASSCPKFKVSMVSIFGLENSNSQKSAGSCN
jgi:hypothetical protein